MKFQYNVIIYKCNLIFRFVAIFILFGYYIIVFHRIINTVAFPAFQRNIMEFFSQTLIELRIIVGLNKPRIYCFY